MLIRHVSLSTPNDALSSLAYDCELSLACTYAIRRPSLAIECATRALDCAVDLRRPDLAWRASELLSAIRR